MKLLMISGDRSILQGKRGAFWYTLQEMSKHWERIDVLCPYSKTPCHGVSTDFPNVFFHPSPWGLLRQPWWISKKGAALVREHSHDIATVHEYPPFYNGLGAWMLKRRTGLPYVLEVHHIVGTPRAADIFEWCASLLSYLFLRFDTLCAKAVRTVNEKTRVQLDGWGVQKEKIHVVPSFYLDRELLTSIAEEECEKKYHVAFCARLVSNKGLASLLHVVALLPTVSLLVIGDGPDRAHNEELVERLGLQDRVDFVGWLDTQKDVLRAMRSARVFVMNSLSEGGPRTALEAMGLGMPVIATRTGVMPDVITDNENGLLVDTPEDLSSAISMLLEDASLREQMGREATKILEVFERRVLVAAYADFLKSQG